MFASSHTLLINTGKMVARIDLAGTRELRVLNVWTRPCNETLSAIALVSNALKLSPRRAGRVWVLTSELWFESVTLAADVSALLSGAQLDQALALEAEADSGVSAFESRLAALKIETASSNIGDDGRWWVTQLSVSEFDQLSEAVRENGARLYGVAHPAAAYMMLAATTAIDDNARVVASPQPSPHAWCEHAPVMTIDENSDELTSTAAWHALASEWAICLARRPPLPLVIAAARQPLSRNQEIALGLTLLLVTGCGCAANYWRTQQQIAQASSAIAQLEQQQTSHEKLLTSFNSGEARVAQMRQEVSKARAHRDKLARDLAAANATHSQQSLRWVALLDALVEAGNSDCWLQKVESKPTQAVLTGIALNNAAAHRFASGLERSLRASGWVVLPAETKLEANQLVTYRVVLEARFTPADNSTDSHLSIADQSTDREHLTVMTRRSELNSPSARTWSGLDYE